jgi:hypothetical protein
MLNNYLLDPTCFWVDTKSKLKIVKKIPFFYKPNNVIIDLYIFIGIKNIYLLY